MKRLYSILNIVHCTYSLACSLNVDPDSIVVNILQKDMFPQDVDTEIRRGCYAICLQLARFVVQYFILKENKLLIYTKFGS